MKKYINGQYIEMTEDEINELKAIEREAYYEQINAPLSLAQKIEMVIESIPTMPQPRTGRPGFLWKPIYDSENNVFAWEEIVDPYYVPTVDGSYLYPYKYYDGIAVEIGKWYYDEDPELPFEAINNGVPSSFYDREYFDVMEV